MASGNQTSSFIIVGNVSLLIAVNWRPLMRFLFGLRPIPSKCSVTGSCPGDLN